MVIIKKRYNSWNARIKRNLKHATFPQGFLRKFVKIAPRSMTILAFSGKQIVGWVFILSVKGENTVSTFINKRYRNRGIATILIGQTLNICPSITLAQWNHTTKVFFRKLRKKHPGRIKVINWWKHFNRYERIVLISKNQQRASHNQ